MPSSIVSPPGPNDVTTPVAAALCAHVETEVS